MRILHLEDSINDAELVEVVVRQEWPHCAIERVSNRAQYESALQLGGFDFILSDYSLPDFDGLSALEMARTWCPEKPFIFLSGTIGEERAVEALKRGAHDYVIKDRPSRLVPAMRQAIMRTDETERRRRVEEALRQNQERFRQIAENVADMIVLADREGRRMYNNPACRDLIGDPESTKGTPVFSEVHPDDAARVRELFRQTLEHGQPRRTEYRAIDQAGRTRAIETQISAVREGGGHVANVLFVSRDVTERREAEARLREQASLLDKARDAICVTDLAHRVTYWNASAERLYGWPAADAQGKDLREFLFARDLTRFKEAADEVLARGEWQGELLPSPRTGGTATVESRWTLVTDAGGAPKSILIINTDVTERRKLETQLLRAQRLESIGTLAGGIAHDLNNVLAPIVMAANVLQYQLQDDKDLKLLDTIESSAQHGAALIRQLLAFARGADGQRAELQVRHLIGDLEKLLRPTLPRTIEFRVRFDEQPWPIMADATQFNQVMINLCVNARDAMPNGGRIEIGTRNERLSEAHLLGHAECKPGPFLHIIVTDTGTGIPDDVLEKIFDPFFTTKEAGKGTGLGLSTVRGILKGHGGFINVESTVGKGTTFHLFFPAVPESVERAEAASRLRSTVGQGEGIVVVDDDHAVRSVIQTVLENKGYRVFPCADGRSALALCRNRRKEVDVVVAELSLPWQREETFVAALKAQDPHIKIIGMSGLLSEGKAREPHVNEVLPKPITAEVLLTAVQRVLGTDETGPKRSSRGGRLLV